jgi:hypothetical protein
MERYRFQVPKNQDSPQGRLAVKTRTDEIPINTLLLDLFSELKKKNETSLRGNFVFPGKHSGKIKTELRENLICVC